MDDQTPTTQAKNGMNPMLIAGIVVVVLLIAGGIFVASKKSSSTSEEAMHTATATPTMVPTTMPSVTSKAATPTAMVQGTATESITVDGGNYYFKPNKITVKKGDSVKITFVNDGGFHDFVLDGYNVKTDIIGSGKSQTVTFTADKAGTFDFYCSVGNHKAMGMAGTLVVQ